MDLWGRIYLDHFAGERHPHRLVRDDGKVHTIESADGYFVAPRSGGELDALSKLTGRVLDLGCGAGSYARFLEDRRVEVTAVDSSAGAIAVCRERGCRDAQVADIDDLDGRSGPFDAVICMGNTIGIGQKPETLHQRLERIAAVIRPDGCLLAVVRDPLSTRDPDHLAYHERNRKAGRPVGLTRSRLEYRGDVGDWWDLWMPTQQELERAATLSHWAVSCLSADGAVRLYSFERIR